MTCEQITFTVAGNDYTAEFIGTREGRPGSNWWRAMVAGRPLWLAGKIGTPPTAEFVAAAEALLIQGEVF